MRIQVSLMRPGTASVLTPNAGTAQEWITSVAVISTRMSVPTGNTTALSVVSSRSCPSCRSSSDTT